MSTTKILVVDNYDSFVYTLVGYLQELGAETTVVRNDDVTLAEAIEMAEARDGVLISPGPGNPAGSGSGRSSGRTTMRPIRKFFGGDSAVRAPVKRARPRSCAGRCRTS